MSTNAPTAFPPCATGTGCRAAKTPLDANDFVARPSDAPKTPVPAAQAEGAGQSAAGKEAEKTEPEPCLEELWPSWTPCAGWIGSKADVKSLINLVKVRKLREENALPVPPMSLHLVFMGNPGTGKTTVARLLAKIYRAVGVLSKGQLVEVDRSGLVAGFVGQTALKTGEVIQKALGGVLFIDEAYALANQNSPNDFGREAIEVLLKGMEDHRKDLIVIVAGYTELMGRFISSNPGLESRFNKYFYFEDYNAGQLMSIFQSMCERKAIPWTSRPGALPPPGSRSFTINGMKTSATPAMCAMSLKRAVSRQADRIARMERPDKEAMMALTCSDLQEDGETAADRGFDLKGL